MADKDERPGTDGPIAPGPVPGFDNTVPPAAFAPAPPTPPSATSARDGGWWGRFLNLSKTSPGRFAGVIALGTVALLFVVASSFWQLQAATTSFQPGAGGPGHAGRGPDGHGGGMMGRGPDGHGGGMMGRGPDGHGGGMMGRQGGGDLGRMMGIPGGLGQVDHGDVVVQGSDGSGPVTLRFVRGQVTAASATALSVKSAEGFSVDFVVDANTKVIGERQQSSIADVRVGDTVVAGGTVAGEKVTATFVATGDSVGMMGNRSTRTTHESNA